MLLNAANTYLGPTIIKGGTLGLVGGSDNRLGTAPATYAPGHLTINGGTLRVLTNSVTLSVNRGIALGAAGAAINIDANQTLTIPGIMTGNSFIKQGSGAVVLQGINTYSGGTTNDAGTLRINNNSALGSGFLQVNNATFSSADFNPRTVTNELRLNGVSTFGEGGSPGVLTFSGPINLLRNVTNTVNGNGLIYSGTVAGAFNLTKNGSQSMLLTGDNTYSGITTVSRGRLSVSGAGDIAQSSAIVVTNQVDVAEVPRFELGKPTDGVIMDRVGNSAPVSLHQTVELILNGTTVAGTTAEDIGSLSLGGSGTGSAITVTLVPGASRDVELQADSLNRTAGSSILFRGSNLGSAAGADTSRITFAVTPALVGGGTGAGTSTISILPYAMADTTATGSGGTSFVTYDPVLGIRLLDINTEYDTALAGAETRNLNVTANTTVAASQGINSVRIGGGNLAVNAGQTLTNISGAILFASGNNINGPGTIASGAAEIVVNVGGNSAFSQQLNAVLDGYNGLTIGGSSNSTLTLGGANTYVGNTFINAGAVVLGSSSALGSSVAPIPGSVRLNLGSRFLDLNGNNASIGRLDGALGVGYVTNSGAAVTLSINTTEGDAQFRANTGGALSLVKKGANTLTLLGSNSITGAITIEGGQLTIDGNIARFPNVTSVTIGNSATNLLNYANGNQAADDRINNAAPIVIAGGRLTFQNNANSGTSFAETLGALTLNSGGAVISGSQADSSRTSALTFASLARNPGATINFSGTGLGDNTRNRMVFTAAPFLTNNLIGGWATVNGTDFATYNGLPSIDENAQQWTNIAETTWLTGSNVVLNAGTSPTLTASRSISTLNLKQTTSGSTVNLGGNTLNLELLGLLASGSFNSFVTNGTLTAGGVADGNPDELFIHTYSAVANPLTMGAVIGDNGGDSVSVVKAGPGVLALAVPNTFSGSLTVSEGTVRFGSGTFPSANTLVLNGGGIASSDNTARTFNNPVTFGGRTILGDSVGTGPLELAGTITLSSGPRMVTVDANPVTGEHVISGNIVGTGDLTKSGVGKLILTGQYSSSGPLTVAAGEVTVKGTAGALLTGGTAILPGGSLVLDNTVNNSGNRIVGDLHLVGGAGGTTFEFRGDGTTSISESLGTLYLYGSSGTVTIKSTQTVGGTTTLTFANLIRAGSSILDFNGTGIGESDENRVFITGLADGPIFGAKVNLLDDAAYSSTLGVYALLNFDLSYTTNSHPIANGGLDAAATPGGWSNITAKVNPQGGVRFTANDVVTISQLKLDNNGVTNTPGYNGVDLNGGSLRLVSGSLASGGASQSITNGGLTAGDGSAPATLTIITAATNLLTIGATITNHTGQTVSLIKEGPGTNLLTSAANTFTGPTRINGGVLGIVADGSLGNAPVAVVTNHLIVNGGTLKLGNGVDIVPNRGITLAAGNGTVRVDDSDSATITSVISGGNRNLTKEGTGTLILNRAQNFSGILALNGGTLVGVTNTAALGAGTLVLNAGTLVLRNDTPLNFARNTSITNGPVTVASDRVTAGAGITNTLGTLAINSQTLTITNGASGTSGINGVTFGAVTLSGAPTFTVNNSPGVTNLLTLGTVANAGNTMTFNGSGNATVGAISGGGGVIQAGSGTSVVSLGGAGTFNGGITIKSGTLQGGDNNNALGDNANVVTLGDSSGSANATLQLQNTRTYAQPITVAAGSSGVLTIAGSLTTGSPILSSGILLNNDLTLANTGSTGILTLSGAVSGAGNLRVNNTATGTGTIVLSGPNTYTGKTTISAGVLSINTIDNVGGAANALGQPVAGPNSVIDIASGGILRYTGSASGTSDRVINLATAAGGTFTLEASGTAPFVLTGDLATAGSGAGTSILTLGGTANTNFSGILGGSIADGVGGNVTAVNKVGAGTWSLAGSNTFSGGVTNTLGTLNIGSTNALGSGTFTILAGTINNTNATIITNSGNNAINLGGNFAFAGTNSLDLGSGAVTLNGVAGNRTITVTNNTLTLGGIVSDGTATGLTKAGAGTLALGGANLYSGGTLVSGGMLLLNNTMALPGGIAVSGGTSALSLSGGVVGLGADDFNRALGTGLDQVQFTGSGGFAASGANRIVNLGGASAGVTWNTGSFVPTGSSLILGHVAADATVDFQNPIDLAAAVRTVQVDNGSAAVDATISGQITGAAGSGFIKTGTGTLLLSQANTYSGQTVISNGTVRLGINNALPTASPVIIGTNSTVGSLDLGASSQTLTSLAVRTDNASLDNTILIAPGQTLTVSGNVTVGTTNASGTTRLVASGGGSLSVGTGGAGSFQVGGNANNAANNTTVTADFSALDSLTVNYDATSTLRLGDASTASSSPVGSTLRFATNTTITVGNFRIGDGSGGQTTHVLTLGSGANLINANTINIGSATTGIRSSGTMQFALSDTTGTVTIRGFTGGSSRAVLNMVNSSGGTAANLTSTVDLTGHTADVMASTMTMASRSATGTGSHGTATFSFDQGSLDVTSLIMSSRSGGAAIAGNTLATMNLGDSATPGVPTVTIGNITMAAATAGAAGATATADLNITGGNVTIGTGSGTAINMANAAAGLIATSSLDITGGTVTVTGNITRTLGAGTETATLTLNGASAILDMTGKNITSLTGITFTDGTLKDIGTINTGVTLAGTGGRVFDQGALFAGTVQGVITGSGVGLTKQGAGYLTLNGANTYDGVTTISGGLLGLGNASALPGDIDTTVGAGESGLTFNGGVLGFGLSDFTRSLGTGAGEVQWTGSGGFAAFTLDRNVNLGGASAAVTWGSGSFVPDGSTLILGDTAADKTVTFQNPINFGASDRTIQVNNGSAPTDAVLSEVLSGTGGLVKTGAGTLALTGSSANTYSGLTTVSGGVLDLDKTGVNAIAGDVGGGGNDKTHDILVNGGTLRLLQNDQIIDSASINVTSGTLNFNNRNETIYNLDVSGGFVNYGTGDITIEDPTWSGGTNTISGNTTFGSLNVSGGDNTVTGTGTGGAGTLTIGTAGTSGPLEFSGNNTTPTIKLNADNATPGTLRFRAGSTIDLIFSGTGTATGLISSDGAGANRGRVSLNGSTRTFNIGDAAGSPVDMTISADVVDLAGSGTGITKTGAGTLLLSGVNTYTGDTTINAGTVQVAGGSAIHDSGKVVLADVAGANLQLNNNETIGALSGGGANGGNVNLQANTLTIGGGTSEGYSGAISGTGNLTLANVNTALTLSPAAAGGNTFSGTTTIGNVGGSPGDTTLTVQGADALAGTSQIVINSGGTLLLAGSGNRVNDTAPVNLNGGILNTMGLTESVGVLTLSASSIIDMTTLGTLGNSVLSFANSSMATWTGTLSIYNWTGFAYNVDPNMPIGSGNADQIFFGSDNMGLTAGQLAQITFFSDAGMSSLGSALILSDGQIVPVPEPATWFAIFGLMAVVGLVERRRVAQIVRSLRNLRGERSE